MSIPIISVTGTKGKTTAVGVIAQVLQKLGDNVLKVDTTGHYINGVQKSTLEDSKNIWRLVPTVAPGRYLWEFYDQPEIMKHGVAVLECALGCSASSGLGYRFHNVGVFLNVFEDHLGSSDRIQSKSDIAKAKEFVFSRLQPENSWAVFNADDELVCGSLMALPNSTDISLLPFGLSFSGFDITSHLKKGGKAITVSDGNELVLRSQEGDAVLADLKAIPWTFNGVFKPSLWNMMAAAGALYGHYDGNLPHEFREALEGVRLDPYGGRLTLLKNREDVTILADYAHEKVSMVEVANLARSLTKGDGRVIGVVRLAHDRSDELISETGQTIAPAYDQLIVFDKIDGFTRLPKLTTNRRFPEVVGRTSEVFEKGIRSRNPNVERIIREDEAIGRAAQIARPNDVVVIIVNDDIRHSIELIQKSFNAEFA